MALTERQSMGLIIWCLLCYAWIFLHMLECELATTATSSDIQHGCQAAFVATEYVPAKRLPAILLR